MGNADRTDVLQTERGAPMTNEVAGFTAVTSAIWRQRESLELLALALAGRGNLRAALDDLQLGEVFRVAEVEELARTLEVPTDVSLAELAAVSAEPWQTLLSDHRLALQRLYTQVTARAALADVRIWQQSLDDFLR
jgi:hypothetical protein